MVVAPKERRQAANQGGRCAVVARINYKQLRLTHGMMAQQPKHRNMMALNEIFYELIALCGVF